MKSNKILEFSRIFYEMPLRRRGLVATGAAAVI